MKAIKNIKSLLSTLEHDGDQWRKAIYDATGVIITNNLSLFSKCGYVSLDSEMDYRYTSGIDQTEYCEINSIVEMIEYIKGMNSYKEILTDISYGQFTKAELLWTVEERILLQKENMNDEGGQDWAFFSIKRYPNSVTLEGALLPCAPVDIDFNIDSSTSLDEVLNQLISELNKETEYYDWLKPQKVYPANIVIPDTYEKLAEQLVPGAPFAWLQGDVEVEITACVYSEKEDISIGFGTSYYSLQESITELGTDWICEGLGDSFWENAYDFEDGVKRAKELCQNDKDIEEALHEVFGTFNISFETNITGWLPKIEVDIESINEDMYAMLLSL